jgi:hypothetical protein
MLLRRRKGPPDRYGRPESVAEFLKIVGAIDDEARATGRHLDTKTAPIAGFAAVTLTLNATLGGPLLRAKLEGPWGAIAHTSYFLAVAALLVAGAAAVVGGLAPERQDDVTPEFVRELAQRPAMTTDPEELRERWLVTLADIAVSDRLANRTASVRCESRSRRWAPVSSESPVRPLPLVSRHERRSAPKPAPSPGQASEGDPPRPAPFPAGGEGKGVLAATPEAMATGFRRATLRQVARGNSRRCRSSSPRSTCRALSGGWV